MKKIIFLIQGIVLLAIGMSYGQAKISPDSTRAADAKPAPGIEWSRSTRDGKAIYYLFDPKTVKSYPMYTGQFANSVFLGKQEAAGLYPNLSGSYANPSWISSLAYSKLTGAPTNVSSFLNDANYLNINSANALFAPSYSGGYIKNQYASPQTANLWISGNLRSYNAYLFSASTYSLNILNSNAAFSSDSTSDLNHGGNLLIKSNKNLGYGLSFYTSLLTGKRLITWRDQDINVAGLADLASYIPYSGAITPVDLNGQTLQAGVTRVTDLYSSTANIYGKLSVTANLSGQYAGQFVNNGTGGGLYVQGGSANAYSMIIGSSLGTAFSVYGNGNTKVYGNLDATNGSTSVNVSSGLLKSVAGVITQATPNTDFVIPSFVSGNYIPYTGAISSVYLGNYNVNAGSFVKQGGTSSQYLMADGSTTTVTPSSGNGSGGITTLTTAGIGAASISGNSLNIPTPTLTALGGQPLEDQRLSKSNSPTFAAVTASSLSGNLIGNWKGINNNIAITGHYISGMDYLVGMTGTELRNFDQSALKSFANYYTYGDNANFATTTANAFVKTGGTASQFLMADGSVSSGPTSLNLSLTTNGSSGPASLNANTLNIPTPTLTALGGQPYENQRLSKSDIPAFAKLSLGTNALPNATLDVRGVSIVGGQEGNLDPGAPDGNISHLLNTGRMLTGWNRTANEGETDFISSQANYNTITGGFAFYDYDRSGNEHQLLRIKGNGNVGIGVMYPSNKLDVAGTIHASEILVDRDGFPDYVFEDGYKLPSLSEVRSFIDKNHRLPDMPSENEVTSKGLKIGETQNILTKKVEELTLYLLEKEKQVNDLKKAQEKLKGDQQIQIEELKKQIGLLMTMSNSGLKK